MGRGGIRNLRSKLGSLGPDGVWKKWLRRSSPFCTYVFALMVLTFFFYLQDGLQSRKDEGACVMHQECQIQPHELSVSPELGSSSPAVTSLASPPLCFSCFLSCFGQTFSRSRKRKSLGREGTRQAEAGGGAKALRPGLLRVLGKSKMQPHWSL